MRRRRVRPRFIFFILILVALVLVVSLLFKHGHSAKPSRTTPRKTQPVARGATAPQAHYTLPPFGLPESLSNFAVSDTGGVVTIAGGSSGHNLNSTVYNMTSNGAVVGGSLAVARQQGGIVVLPTHDVYVGGIGTTNIPSKSAQSFNGSPPISWLPASLSGFATTSTGGSTYLVGGNTASGPSKIIYRVTPQGKIYAWAVLPHAVVQPMAQVMAGSLYVVGGELSSHHASAAIYRFGLTSRRIHRLGSLPVGVYDGAMGMAGGSLWILGGYVHHKVSSQTWVLVGNSVVAGHPLPQALAGEEVAQEGQALWIMGGITAHGVSSTIYVLKSVRR